MINILEKDTMNPLSSFRQRLSDIIEHASRLGIALKEIEAAETRGEQPLSPMMAARLLL